MKSLVCFCFCLTISSFIASSQIIITSNWEDGELLAPGIQKETTTAYGMVATDSFARTGSYSCRFETRHGDPPWGGSVRSEQKTGDIFNIGQEIWAGYSLMYPNSMTNTNKDEIVGQWHQKNQDGIWSGPAIGVHNKGDFTFYTYVRLGVDSKGKTLPMGTIPKGEWVDFVWNIRFATDSTGFIKCWINGDKRIDYKGACGYIGGYGINFKFGIYPGFKTDFTSQSPRIIYWDEIRIADSTADFSYVTSGSGVGLQSQIITFPSINDKLTTAKWFVTGATSSSGLPVSFTSSDTSVAVICGDTVFIKGTGRTTIIASQSGDSIFRAALPVERSFRVTDPSKMLQTINFPPLEPRLTTDTPFSPGATTSSGLSVHYSSSDTLIAIISDNLVYLKSQGKTIITAFQPGDANFNPAEEISRILNVSAPSTLPLPWHSTDIGSPAISGRSILFNGDYSINASGTDVWGSSDQFHFMYQELGKGCSNTTLNPAHDAFIRKDNTADGISDSILIKNGGGTYFREGYIKFDLSFLGCSSVESAKLRMNCNLHEGGNVDLFEVPDNSWTETSINWNNRPSAGNLISTTPGKTGYMEWDVTGYVNNQLSEFSDISFMLQATDDAFISFHSREAAMHKPELVISGNSEKSEKGNGTVIAEVKSISNTDFNAKAGIMIRESLEPGSKMAYVAQRPNKEVAFDVRKERNGNAEHTISNFSGGTTENKWLKLSRTGDTISAYYSTSGSTGPWNELIEKQIIPMSDPVYAGFFVTSHNEYSEATGLFGNIKLESPIPANTTTFVKSNYHPKPIVYPNPLISEMLTIEIDGKKSISVEIFNIIGKKLHDVNINEACKITIPKSRFPAKGIYFIKMHTSDSTETIKLIVQ